MVAKNFSKRMARLVFNTLQEETNCWDDVCVKVANVGDMYVNINVSQDSYMISQPVMREILNICDSFEMVYGLGTCGCSFEVEDGKPVCNVSVRIKK